MLCVILSFPHKANISLYLCEVARAVSPLSRLLCSDYLSIIGTCAGFMFGALMFDVLDFESHGWLIFGGKYFNDAACMNIIFFSSSYTKQNKK